MNSFLIIYLIILLFEAILSTILKYAWQAEEKWDEPWYNEKTEHERNSSKVILFCPVMYLGNPQPLYSECDIYDVSVLGYRFNYHMICLQVCVLLSQYF